MSKGLRLSPFRQDSDDSDGESRPRGRSVKHDKPCFDWADNYFGFSSKRCKHSAGDCLFLHKFRTTAEERACKQARKEKYRKK